MQMITVKTKPRTVFGIILAVTGVIVIILTFISNHNSTAQTVSQISCSTERERISYLNSLGWETDDASQDEKEITIPSVFNEVYEEYNEIQIQQGFDLSQYKGMTATLYTYEITNYGESDNVKADLIVYDGNLIGADLCDNDADNGFLIALEDGGDGQT